MIQRGVVPWQDLVAATGVSSPAGSRDLYPSPRASPLMNGAAMAAVVAVIALWGVAHVVPTRQVIVGFGQISSDSRRVLLQEWLAEAVTMWMPAGVVFVTTALGVGSATTDWVYRVVAAAPLVPALLTGARTSVIWFRICPALLRASNRRVTAGWIQA